MIESCIKIMAMATSLAFLFFSSPLKTSNRDTLAELPSCLSDWEWPGVLTKAPYRQSSSKHLLSISEVKTHPSETHRRWETIRLILTR